MQKDAYVSALFRGKRQKDRKVRIMTFEHL
jgi:hypothetical protein